MQFIRQRLQLGYFIAVLDMIAKADTSILYAVVCSIPEVHTLLVIIISFLVIISSLIAFLIRVLTKVIKNKMLIFTEIIRNQKVQ